MRYIPALLCSVGLTVAVAYALTPLRPLTSTVSTDLIKWFNERNDAVLSSGGFDYALREAMLKYDESIFNRRIMAAADSVDTRYGAKIDVEFLNKKNSRISGLWVLGAKSISGNGYELVMLTRSYAWMPQEGVGSTPVDLYYEVWRREGGGAWRVLESGPWLVAGIDSLTLMPK